MKTIVSKTSIRELVHKKRLPSYFRMYVAGCWLYDVLQANNLEKKLMAMTYWVTVKSLNSKQSVITWRPA